MKPIFLLAPILFFSISAQAVPCSKATYVNAAGVITITLSGCSAVVTPPKPPITPPVVTPPADPNNVSIEGIVLPNPSKSAFVVGPQHSGAMGAGSEINAYAMNPARCNTVPALTASWQHNISLDNYKGKNAFDFFYMTTGQALSYKFTVPTIDTSGGFLYNDAANAVVRPTFMSITAAPCDFNPSKVSGAGKDACYVTGLNGNSINWANITGPLPVSYCRLTKGNTYFINLRFQDARPVDQGGSPTTDSCVSGNNCGGILQVL